MIKFKRARGKYLTNIGKENNIKRHYLKFEFLDCIFRKKIIKIMMGFYKNK